jgi:hypothetical protein
MQKKFVTCALITLAGISTALTLAAQEIKVDINNNNRAVSEGLDPAYTSWNTNSIWFPGGDSITNTFGGVTIRFTRVGPVGTALEPNYWKAGVQSTTFNVKLTADGIKVASGDAGGQIEMRISGLAAGNHTLLTYHSVWDNLVPSSVAPLDISVDGVTVVTNLSMSVRVTNNALATTAYLNLDAVAGQDVVVLFRAETAGAQATKNVYINGFEIDTANSTVKAFSPTPQDRDEHVNADNHSQTLNWAAAGSAVSHDVYFGSDSNAVKTATHASAAFKGNQTATNYPVTNLNSLLTYYWRIDEVNATNGVARGDLWLFRPRHLAFPSAEGYGRFARGGSGGVVVEVTNTNDSGPGSLRDALTGNYGPRTVVFTVSGLITLESDLIINGNNPYITLAGQTAPGKGICTRKYQLGMSGARDVIVRNVRSRPGNLSGTTLNGSGMAGVDHCIMDHCSISWGIDEEMSTRNARNVTLQRTLISEALNIAGHKNYGPGFAHGFAASIGGDVGSFHHNLLAHCQGRNWSMAGGLDGAGYYAGQLDIRNNVVYNWRTRTTEGGAHEVNFVNNYYKPGAAIDLSTYSSQVALDAQYNNFPGTQQYFFDGNVMPGYFGLSNQAVGRVATLDSTNGVIPTTYPIWVDAPFFEPYVTTQTATNAYKIVLSDVGCNQPLLDDHDARVVRETIDGTYTYTGTGPYGGFPGLPNSQDDVGGWEDYPALIRPANFDTDHDGLPDWWERLKGLNTNSPAGDFSDANADLVGDEYTELEHYLNWMAAPHVDCLANASVDVDLTALTRGFTNTSPVYSVFNPTNGTVTLVGGRTARFTPTVATNSLGSFVFAVVDAKGDTMTNSVGVRIQMSSASGNSAPVLAAISNRTINVGVNLLITNQATDPDANGLAFSLMTTVTNATINSGSGIFAWRPLVTQANTTNQFAVVVTDNGSPNLSATQSFNVTVNPLIQPGIASNVWTGGRLSLSVSGQTGPDYAVQVSSNLSSWSTLLITNSPAMPFQWTDPDTNACPARFYRIKTGPPLP